MISYKNITKKRKEFGLSQEELAKRLGVSRPTLLKIEKGERKLTHEEKQELEEVFAVFEADDEKSDARISIPEQKLEKFKQVLLYILEQVGAKQNVGVTVMYKLLYFVDFDYYEKYETQLMGLTYWHNHHGPAPREFKKVVDGMEKNGELVRVQSKYFKHEQKKHLPRKSPDLSLLSGQELEMVDDVLDRYSDMSAKQIADTSHRDMPWKATKYGENIDYELAFYRSEEFSVREYEEL